MEFKGFHAGS